MPKTLKTIIAMNAAKCTIKAAQATTTVSYSGSVTNDKYPLMM